MAASPHDAIADTHWYRADFDHLSFARPKDGCGLPWMRPSSRVTSRVSVCVEFVGHRQGSRIGFSAVFVVDATGPRGFLIKSWSSVSGTSCLDFPRTQALYSHFTGVKRLDDCATDPHEIPPYPVDDAAVHHVFDGGWIWVLRFNNGVTSAGISATDRYADEFNLLKGPKHGTESCKAFRS